MQETSVRSLGQEDPLKKKMATHPSILAWEIPWKEEPEGPQSMVSQRIRLVWATEHARIWYSTKLRRHTKKNGKNVNSLSTDKAINTTRLKVTQILEPSDWKFKITMSSEINQREKKRVAWYRHLMTSDSDRLIHTCLVKSVGFLYPLAGEGPGWGHHFPVLW